ncbi:hypothetical protein PFISCL1PPCAC_22004, partial [Pristionchus fissidentatus]
IVCGEKRDWRTLRAFTCREPRREEWIRAVRQTTEARNELRTRLSEMVHPMLCESHFPAEAFDVTPTTITLKGKACPKYTYPETKQSIEIHNRLPNSLSSASAVESQNRPHLRSSVMGWDIDQPCPMWTESLM